MLEEEEALERVDLRVRLVGLVDVLVPVDCVRLPFDDEED